MPSPNDISALSQEIVDYITENLRGDINFRELKRTITRTLKRAERNGTLKKFRGRYYLETNEAGSYYLTGLFLQKLASKCGPRGIVKKRHSRRRSRSGSRSRSHSRGCRSARKTRRKRSTSSRCRSTRKSNKRRHRTAMKKRSKSKPRPFKCTSKPMPNASEPVPETNQKDTTAKQKTPEAGTEIETRNSPTPEGQEKQD